MRTKTKVPTGLLAVVAVVLVVAAACRYGSSAEANTSLPSAQLPAGAAALPADAPSLAQPGSGDVELSLDPSNPQDEFPGECRVHTAFVDRIPTTVETNAALSSAVVRATVEAIGSGQWNTKDGRIPADLRLTTAFDVMSLVRVRPVDVLLGSAMPTTYWSVGGTIGCHTFSATGFELTEGGDYLFFLSAHDPETGLSPDPPKRTSRPPDEGRTR